MTRVAYNCFFKYYKRTINQNLTVAKLVIGKPVAHYKQPAYSFKTRVYTVSLRLTATILMEI